jgi:prepilin-type N-terminal cleavage/methylation domain-containing protein
MGRAMKRGFTLIELVVAVALLALITSFAGAIFSASIDSYRTAMANAEIMQKLRAITDQLDTDFRHLRKDGEIYAIWRAQRTDPIMNDPDRHIRFDRIMFFANGDFQAYRDGNIRGDVARITYMLGNRAWGDLNEKPPAIRREERILTRTQHILTSDNGLDAWMDPSARVEEELIEWRNAYEYDRITMQQWKNMLWGDKKIAFSVAVDVDYDGSGLGGGAVIAPGDANATHMYLCEGVGEFKIQGWYSYDAARAVAEDRPGRWVPEFAEGDFDGLAPDQVAGVIYSDPPDANVQLGGDWAVRHAEIVELLNEEHFNEIPGLGRALKFTFTLYDSKGIIREGRTFTHIVYLDD